MPIKTRYYKGLIPKEYGDEAYEYLRETIEWEDGVKSKKGFTRKAKPLMKGQNEIIDGIIEYVEARVDFKVEGGVIWGIYLNYYQNGEDYTPNHRHDSCQLIISLGGARTLKIGQKEYLMESGDVCIFGKSIHGVPKEPERTEGRISIACFIYQIPYLGPTDISAVILPKNALDLIKMLNY